MAEADMSSQHRRAAEMHLPGFQHDSLIQRQMVELVVFAEEDAKQDGVMRNLHGQTHLMALIVTASTKPAHTANMQSATDRPILAPACNHSPSFIRLSV